MDTYPSPAQSLEKYYHVDGVQLEGHYKEHLSDFNQWPEKGHAEKWLIFLSEGDVKIGRLHQGAGEEGSQCPNGLLPKRCNKRHRIRVVIHNHEG